VLLLLAAGADVIATTKYGNTTALVAASRKGHVDIVRVLLNKGASVVPRGVFRDNNALIQASQNGYVEIVTMLLSHGAEVNPREMPSLDGSTPLIAASENGHEEVVRVLLDSGADTELPDSNNATTALVAAAENGYKDIVKLLLAYGTNINYQKFFSDFLHQSALIAASENGHEEVVRVLLDSGADTELKTGHGKTALRVAVEGEHMEVVRMLIDSGARIDTKTSMLLRASEKQGGTEKDKLEQYTNGSVKVKKRLFHELVKNKDNWPALIRGLEANGDPDLAESFMNESTSFLFGKGSTLYDAGINWARSHGCRVTRVSRAGSVYYVLGGCYGY
jgi:ankyrin repeat protein